jgi:hypothetical protein
LYDYLLELVMSIHAVSKVVVHIVLLSCVATNQLAQASAGYFADALHLLTHRVSCWIDYGNAIPYLFVSCLRLQVCTAHVARSLLPGVGLDRATSLFWTSNHKTDVYVWNAVLLHERLYMSNVLNKSFKFVCEPYLLMATDMVGLCWQRHILV